MSSWAANTKKTVVFWGELEMIKMILAATSFLLLVTPTFANQCVTLAQAAEDEMNRNLDQGTTFLSQVLTDIMRARDLHRAGKHSEAIAKAHNALKLLSK